MRNGKHTLISLVIVALVGLAIGIPAALAAGQPQDSRPVYRGLGPAPSVTPDDRSFDRAVPVASKTSIGGPDDRRFSRATPNLPTAPPATVSVQPRGFDWGDAMIGGSFGLVLALLGAGAVAFARHHRRDVLRTA
jgi:hypothetical protein